jgi:protocatechuate 3,4-dioxygenase beta subunit
MIVMPTHRHSLVLLAAAVLTCVTAIQGRQVPAVPNPPARPGSPVRDPGRSNTPPPVGTAILSGTVGVAGSGLPARRARVVLSGMDVDTRTTVTDAQGRFVFSGLPAGRYSLTATKPGHVAANFGQPRPGRPGTPIQLADGQKFDAGLQLTRGGVLTGTVLDEEGEALPGTQVRALRFVMQNGQRTLQSAGGGSTDDRGIYRIFGLQPGDYIVAATPRNTSDGPNLDALRTELEALRQRADTLSRADDAQAGAVASRLAAVQAAVANLPESSATGYAPVYYPGTTAAALAAATALAPGEERAGLDFQLQRVPVARVEGFVVNSTGQPFQNIQVTLRDLSQAAPGIGNYSARTQNEGRFEFSNVPPGQYRIAARAVPGGRGGGRGEMQFKIEGRGARPQPVEQVRLWASADITVDGRDLTNVALSLQPGVSIAGRVAFHGTSAQAPSDPSRIRVTLVPADSAARELAGSTAGRVDASGKFIVSGVVPGRYRLSAGGAPQGWVVESAAIEGQDALDFPFEVSASQNVGTALITFTDQRSELTGAVVDSRGQPAPGYTLLLYPADPRYWTPQSRRIRTARPATDGQFLFATVPPGDYRIVPLADVEPGAWFDPAFLQQLDAAALRVSIAEGEKKVQNVRLSGGG